MMMNVYNLIWLLVLIIYFLSPWDLHPLFIDDLIALGLIYFLIYKYKKRTLQNQRASKASYRQQQRKEEKEDLFKNTKAPVTLKKAYAIFELTPEATEDAIKKAYKEKIAKNHPDKVSHLSKELQEKAKEMTILINEAYELIKKDRKL